jgi:hypothetical protein
VSWEIKRLSDGMIEVISIGQFNFKIFQEQVMETLKVAKEIDSYLLLINHYDAIAQVTILDSCDAEKFLFETRAPKIVRIAIILPQTKYNEENYKFLETFCVNRGHSIKLFDDKKSALEWLKTFI